MHWVNDSDEDIHLTRDEYSQSINNVDYYEAHNLYGFTPSQCQWMVDNIMVEIQHKYDLRPIIGNPRSGEGVPPKNTVPTKRVSEKTMTPQVVATPIPPRAQNASQASRTKP